MLPTWWIVLLFCLGVLGSKTEPPEPSGNSFAWVVLGLFIILVVVLMCVGIIMSHQTVSKFQVNGMKSMMRDVESGVDDLYFHDQLNAITWNDDAILKDICESGKIN